MLVFMAGCSEKTAESSSAISNSDSAAELSGTTNQTSYADKLFDSSYVHSVNIEIADSDWNDLIENPLDKTKYETNITIDGETIEQVSFSTKGNTSLSSVAQDKSSNRYSFKINFGKYVDGQTYYGLNKLNLNNIYADATYMKDYLSYEIFRQAGVESPLVSYIWLTVNGEEQGLYIAVEDISEGYLNRTADGSGNLYKPETQQLANMNEHTEMPQMPENGEMPQMPENGEMPQMPGNGEMGFGSGSNGASLSYSDDEIGSYSDIFDNAVTDVDEEDMKRVIAALKSLSEGENLEEILDTDEVIRYFAAHNFVLNYDSYTGNMLHNYYLYENNGKLSMLPWDYNLAFGAFSGMGGGGQSEDNVTSLVNTGIDTPLSGTEEDQRPMWNWIVSDENYLQHYHEVYDELISGYFESGEFETQIDTLYEMLLPYVEKDSSAFYNAEEFKKAYETLREFCLLRAESIRLQLDGQLSANSDEQSKEVQIDASGITVSDMGSQGGGKDGDMKFGKFPGNKNEEAEKVPDKDSMTQPEKSSETSDST